MSLSQARKYIRLETLEQLGEFQGLEPVQEDSQEQRAQDDQYYEGQLQQQSSLQQENQENGGEGGGFEGSATVLEIKDKSSSEDVNTPLISKINLQSDSQRLYQIPFISEVLPTIPQDRKAHV
eukprot:TRINITY_DN72904_c0_g1_i1.p3 TRINITY_DN72904_c0_g1~~TRINITY_DN72904_c0_g1_i1.p3  ORF type:complete len:123 (+),score=13.32 TRINITY_DN72904_c0_g1_i1:107-475(+)